MKTGKHRDVILLPNLNFRGIQHMPAALLTLPLATSNFILVFGRVCFGSGRLSYTSLLMMVLIAPESIKKAYVFPLISASANQWGWTRFHAY